MKQSNGDIMKQSQQTIQRTIQIIKTKQQNLIKVIEKETNHMQIKQT
jgi:hypothetical protein